MHPVFDIVLSDLRIDARQMVEEGHDLAALNAQIDAVAVKGSLDALAALQEEMWRRPSPASFPYEEPSDWEGIARHFPDPAAHQRFSGGEAELADNLHAAWQGRCVGCQLGKPLECAWPEVAKEVCVNSDSWPLVDYLKPIQNAAFQEKLATMGEEGRRILDWQKWTKGNFSQAISDDDINYAIVGLMTLEAHGIDFTSDQAIATLVRVNPQAMLFASGLNMVRKAGFGVKAPLTAVFGNPNRQSLGAQIRCDPFGWAAPANPALAAKMAFTDACCSQTRNGIYSGIFFAVALADTLAHGDPVRALETAEQYVPPKSRFAEMIRFTRQACRQHAGWEEANAAIYARYDQDFYAPQKAPMNHCLINAAIVIMAILKGYRDFSRTVCISVMAGRDTDCNGATAGSIMGFALGTAGIPSFWTAPLHDIVGTDIVSLPTIRISELARRTFELARKNVLYHR